MNKTEIQQLNEKLDRILKFQKVIIDDLYENKSLLDELSAKIKKISDNLKL